MVKDKIHLPHVPEEQFPVFHKHVCPPTFNGGPVDRVEPTRRIERQLKETVDVEFPDGEKLRRWTIRDRQAEDGRDTFPSKLIRTVEGDIGHARVHNSTETHTIHWHGIEPSPVNDGVGKHSFEVSGNFVYQFATNHPGTYFFHCHKNTTLHFELGLYGLFIVDPRKPNTAEAAGIPDPPYPTGGPGFCSAFNPPTYVRKYDVEALWVVDESPLMVKYCGRNPLKNSAGSSLSPLSTRSFIFGSIELKSHMRLRRLLQGWPGKRSWVPRSSKSCWTAGVGRLYGVLPFPGRIIIGP